MKLDLNNPSPSFLMGSSDDDQPPFGSNSLAFSSSSLSATTAEAYVSCRMLFHPIQDMRLHEDNYVPLGQGSSRHDQVMKTEVLELWKADDHGATVVEPEKTIDPVKWNMYTKTWLKIKNPDHGLTLKMASNGSNEQGIDDHNKLHPSPCSETYKSSNDHNSSYNNISPVRVCSDCNTTKTPLWRSGPKGPKSLCNACGIRQRKARRAMAAALASASGAVVATGLPLASKIKVQHKAKASGKNGLASQLKKHPKLNAAATTTGDDDVGLRCCNGKIQKPGLEDFLIKLSRKIAFNRVCPQDEKDAAILLMALSSGLVHG